MIRSDVNENNCLVPTTISEVKGVKITFHRFGINWSFHNKFEINSEFHVSQGKKWHFRT